MLRGHLCGRSTWQIWTPGGAPPYRWGKSQRGVYTWRHHAMGLLRMNASERFLWRGSSVWLGGGTQANIFINHIYIQDRNQPAHWSNPIQCVQHRRMHFLESPPPACLEPDLIVYIVISQLRVLFAGYKSQLMSTMKLELPDLRTSQQVHDLLSPDQAVCSIRTLGFSHRSVTSLPASGQSPLSVTRD
jgi:hypothetical protein